MSRHILSIILTILVLFEPVTPVFAQSPIDGGYSVVRITAPEAIEELQAAGIPLYGGDHATNVAVVNAEQLRLIQSLSIPFVVLKSDQNAPASPQAAQLRNQHLTVNIMDSGQFTMSDAAGRLLLYPYAETSYLSIYIDGQVYTNYDGSLGTSTPLAAVDSTHAYIVYQTSEGVQVQLSYTLTGEVLQTKLDFVNNTAVGHFIQARYLLDTQVDINDGSPLYALPVGARTYETDMWNPSFGSWQAYDIWPAPGMTTVGTLSTVPYRMVFAHWPHAFGYTWDYSIDPAQAFYTPGYTQSPQSDSCVLEYYSLGFLAAGSSGQIVSYYGLGTPETTLDRAQLVAAFSELRDATKGALLADVDAYARIAARYYTTMRVKLDAQWYVEAAWTVFGEFLPSPNFGGRATRMVKLAKDFQALDDLAEAVSLFDYAAQLGWAMGDLFNDIPPGASETEIVDSYIKPFLLNQLQFGSYTGINQLLSAIDNQYQSVVAALPNPLPVTYPIEDVITSLSRQRTALLRSRYQETAVPYLSSIMCRPDVTAGAMNAVEAQMNGLCDSIETADSWSWAMTLTEMGVWGAAGAIKIASIVGVATIPVGEAVFWGTTAAVATVPGVIGAYATLSSLSDKGALTDVAYLAVGQLASDIAMLTDLYQSTTQYVQFASGLNAAQGKAQPSGIEVADVLEFQAIDVPDVTVAGDSNFATGNGTLTLKNTTSVPVSVAVRGSITAQRGGGMEIIGLAGSAPVTLQPGEIKPLGFSFTILRSSLVHSAGYDIHVYASYAPQGSAARGTIGPFTSHFFAGNSGELQAWGQHESQIMAQAQVAQGGTYTQSIGAVMGAQSIRLLLSFAETSDLDLHLYDSQGRHTGMNYLSGMVESQIPGVTYGGASNWPEWMVIGDPSQDYVAEVIGLQTLGGGAFELSRLNVMPLPALIAGPARLSLDFARHRPLQTQTERYSFPVYEAGGSQGIQNVALAAGAFQDGSGHSLPAGSVSCAMGLSIPAGGQETVTCSITIAPAVSNGVYTGQITISGQGAQGTPVSANVNITLSVFSILPNDLWLPLLCK